MALPVILDVDTGVDDALAIITALGDPRLDVRAITCVNGNAGLDHVVQNTTRLLALLGRPDIPIGRGAAQPLFQAAADASHVHGSNGLADLDLGHYGDVSAAKTVTATATDVTLAAIHDSPDPLTLIGLGPLTNTAILLDAHPAEAARIRRIAFMGGAINGGNMTAVAEFNVFADPEATQRVISSGIPCLMYGLDVFYPVGPTQQQLRTLGAHRGPVHRLCASLIEHLAGLYAAEPRVTNHGLVSSIGDAGLVCAVAQPDHLTARRWPVNVELNGDLTRGQTVVDQRWVPGGHPFLPIQHDQPLLDVAVSVQGARYWEQFSNAVNHFDPTMAPTPPPSPVPSSRG